MSHHFLLVSLSTCIKNIFLILSCLLLFYVGSAQTLVNTTGLTISDGNYTIEYSVGEMAITTLSSSDSYVTQGLLQPIIKIDIDACKMLDLIPTAFTPNNDGLNDCYGVSQWPYTSSFEMNVFNRWGELIFRTTDRFACWDGKFKGEDQPAGVYVYMIRATTGCGPTFKKGTFVLIR